jgi:hypothetical protein
MLHVILHVCERHGDPSGQAVENVNAQENPGSLAQPLMIVKSLLRACGLRLCRPMAYGVCCAWAEEVGVERRGGIGRATPNVVCCYEPFHKGFI